MTSFQNNLHVQNASGQLCKAYSIKISSNVQLVLLARNAGFDALFIDLEHGWLSLEQTSTLCITGLLAGVTPFVRVPHQCGDGFIQRVLDGGAMGIVFPHIHSADDAKAAVRISKYPPQGNRSVSGQQPVLGMKTVSMEQTIKVCNESCSSVIAMIESKDAIKAIDQIAAVDGVDVLLVGSADLSVDLGVPGQLQSDTYKSAVESVGQACDKHGKLLGVAGVYGDLEIRDWAINTLGARFMMVQQDATVLSSAAAKGIESLLTMKA